LHQQLRQVLALCPNSFAPPLATRISHSIGCHRGRPATTTAASVATAVAPPPPPQPNSPWLARLVASLPALCGHASSR
jgi:hypothetical protein